jgi:hypothetical protein
MGKISKKVVIIIISIPIIFIAVPIASMLLFGFGMYSAQKSCEGVDIFPNPLYERNSHVSSDGYREYSVFGEKDGLIYRISSDGSMPNVCMKMEHADAPTFKVLSYHHAKDKNNAYVQFYYLHSNRSKEEYTIFDIDSETFEILDGKGEYSKDKKNVYYRAKVLEGADPETFELLEYGTEDYSSAYYTKDKDHVFCSKEIFKDASGEYSDFTKVADVTTFQLLNEWYAKDKNHVYNSGEIIDGADPITFEVVQTGECYSENGGEIVCPRAYDAFDKNNKYKYGKMLSAEEANNYESSVGAYEFIPIQGVDLKNGQSLIKSVDSPGKAFWDRKVNALVLETGSSLGGTKDNVVVFTEAEVPSGTEVMKFRFNFPNDEDVTRSVLGVFFGQTEVYNSHAGIAPPFGKWKDSLWIEEAKEFAGKKVGISFRLSKLKDDGEKQGRIFLDNIVFGKLEKVED